MKLFARRQEASSRYDHLACVRADGSRCEVAMPRQGILPHDLIHLLVESRLGFSDGFIGLVAKGADPQATAEQLHTAADPARQTQAAQAEAVVESLQAQLWSGSFDAALFRYGVATACAMRAVPVPELGSDARWHSVFDEVERLGGDWNRLPPMAQWELAFPWQANGLGGP